MTTTNLAQPAACSVAQSIAWPTVRDGIGNDGWGGSKIRNPKAIVWRFWSEPARWASFARGARDNLLFLGKWLALAFMLESLMLAYLPADLVAKVAGGGRRRRPAPEWRSSLPAASRACRPRSRSMRWPDRGCSPPISDLR